MPRNPTVSNMVRRKAATRAPVADIGFDCWDLAATSFQKCPRCSARALVRHIEPHSGGGQMRHLHRCRRCRHEWEAPPDHGQVCAAPFCDHGR